MKASLIPNLCYSLQTEVSCKCIKSADLNNMSMFSNET